MPDQRDTPPPTIAATPAPSPLLRWGYVAAWVLVAALFALRFLHLSADFTSEKDYSRDGVLYSDEGWYAGNAIFLMRTGAWHQPGDLNFAVNLPTLQVLQAASFALFGVNIIAARLTILLCFAVLLALIHEAVRRWGDRWTALLAVAVVCWNFFFLQFSRFAIAELCMAAFACGAFFAAGCSGGRRGWLLSALAGLLWALAFYAKTSAIFAVPILGAILLAANWQAETRRRRWLIALPAAGAAGAVVLLHTLLLALPYREDYQCFYTLNVGMRASTDPGAVIGFFFEQLNKMELIDKVLYRVIRFLPVLLLLGFRSYRRNPLVLFALAYVLIYTAMFSFYVNLRPRYWAPLLVPYGILTALSVREIAMRWHLHWTAKAGTVLLGAALLGSLGNNLKLSKEYFGEIQYTFADMAADVKRNMGDDRLLLSHISMTVALHADVVPMNDRYAATPLEDRLPERTPRWLLTEDTIFRLDSKEERENNYPGSREHRRAVLESFYDSIVEVAAYDVFDNYKDYRLHLYRVERAAK